MPDWDRVDNLTDMDSDAAESWRTIGPTSEQEEVARKRKREQDDDKDDDWNVMD